MAISVNFLHLLLQIIGLNRSLSILRHFLKNPKIIYEIPSEDKLLAFSEYTNRLFNAFRGRKFVYCNCLSSSILLWFILKRQGLDTHLLIGAKKNNGKLVAHAWIEIGQYPLNAGKEVRQGYSTFKHDFSQILNTGILQSLTLLPTLSIVH